MKKVYVLFFWFIGFSGILLFLEFQYQNISWVNPNVEFDSETGWAPMKNSSQSDNGIIYATNRFGFWSSEVISQKKHILLLGDDVIWGSGNDYHKTLSYFLEMRFPDYQIVNLSSPGYGIGQSYLRMNRHLNSLNHVLILFLYLW